MRLLRRFGFIYFLTADERGAGAHPTRAEGAISLPLRVTKLKALLHLYRI